MKMRKATRILAVVCLLALLVCMLSACGEKVQLKILETAYAEEDYAICFAKNSEYTEPVNAALEELMADGTVQAIVDKYINGVENDLVFQQDVADDAEELHMATNAEFPPYEYYEGDGIVGIDAEVAAAIADKLGMKLVIDDMAFDSIISAVTSGKAAFGMAGMTVTEDRLESVDFSTSYATGVQVVIVTEDSEITSVDDLFEPGGYTIGVQTNTTGDIYSTQDIEDKGLGTVQRYNKGADAVQALVTGKVDCVIIDNEPAKAFVEANNQ